MPHRQTPVNAVAEIVINVNQLGKMQQFYETVLGFEFFEQIPAENPTIVFLKIADLNTALSHWGHPQLFVLIDVHRHPGAINRFKGIDIDRSTFNHVAFEIASEDFEAEKKRLESHGLAVRIQEFPHHKTHALFFHDPEGNLIELICPHRVD